MVHSDLTEAPKHDANNIVLFIQNACIKNNLYQYNYLNYNLISNLQQIRIRWIVGVYFSSSLYQPAYMA